MKFRKLDSEYIQLQSGSTTLIQSTNESSTNHHIHLKQNTMGTNYLCPHCRGILNVKGRIILSAKNSKDEKGLLLLHPEIGNYSSCKNDDFQLTTGEKISLYCSICHSNLDSDKHENFAQIQYQNVHGKESTVIFSKIYGEEVTHLFEDEKVISYGEHCKRYADPEWFLKSSID